MINSDVDYQRKINFYDLMMCDTTKWLNITKVANILHYANPSDNKVVTRNMLFQLLRDNNILYRDSQGCHVPYQEYKDKLWFHIAPVDNVDKHGNVYYMPVVSPEGVLGIKALLDSLGFVPVESLYTQS